MFTETNGVEADKREATHTHGSKCVDCTLATDGMSRKVKGCELTECSEIVESDHGGCLIDVYFAEWFSEDFVEDEERAQRNLNPNRKIHREKFVDKCNTLLDRICIESDLIEVDININRAKIEQIDSDTTRVLTKALNVQKEM